MHPRSVPRYRSADLEDLFAARARFLEDGALSAGVRPVVARSWQRARAYALDPRTLRSQRPSDDTLERARAESRELVEHGGAVLEEMAAILGAAPHVLALADRRGRILRLIAAGVPPAALRAANLFAGASWHERDIGCNGVGTTLAERAPVILIGPEHFQDAYTGWTCIGVPIRGPDGEIAGVIDLSVPNAEVDLQTWGWTLSTARVLELQLKGGGESAAPIRTHLSESLEDPLNAARGVLDLLGTQLTSLPTHRRLVSEGLRKLEEARARLAHITPSTAPRGDAEIERRTAEKLAALAHELRSPIGAIGMAAELVAHTVGGEPSAARALAVIRRQLEVLARLAGDVGSGALAWNGGSTVEPKRLDFRRVVEDAVDAASLHIVRRGHQLRVRVPDGPLWVTGDPVRLVQALVNVVVNAAKYTDAGGRIDLGCERCRDEIVVRVSDTGRGIAADQLGRIFDPFARAEDQGERDGLGVGLGLVHAIVESHRGRVAAHSDGPGQGSVFTIWLPADHGAESVGVLVGGDQGQGQGEDGEGDDGADGDESAQGQLDAAAAEHLEPEQTRERAHR
jgi:signal transduction histidine kinase